MLGLIIFLVIICYAIAIFKSMIQITEIEMED